MLTYENDFAKFLTARDAGERVEVDVEMFDYFLDVLPPVYMSRMATLPDGMQVRATYGMAEGWEPITAFWRERGDDGELRYFAQRTAEINRG